RERDERLEESLRSIRCSLLAEHIGGGIEERELMQMDDLVARLDRSAENDSHHLWHHDLQPPFSSNTSSQDGSPGGDEPYSNAPSLNEEDYERLDDSADTLLARGIRLLEERLR
ncbi:MAG: hypothetical protein JSV80_08375, partial [Acidobacteriota bacterium]